MLKKLRLDKNENLIRNILKYNNVKDLSITCQVNKTFKRSTDYLQMYWREEMIIRFSSDFLHYNIIEPQNLSDHNEANDYTNWKDLMKRAFDLKQSWIIDCNLQYINDTEKIKNELSLRALWLFSF